MVLVDSLLTAILRADGEALVMHVGERPYVVAPSGPVELSSRPLTFEAVSGMLAQLLPSDARRAVDELGAIEHDLAPSEVAPGERFTVVAARGGDDIWIEVRRHRKPVAPPVEPPVRPAPPPEPEPEPIVAEIPAEVPALAEPAFEVPPEVPFETPVEFPVEPSLVFPAELHGEPIAEPPGELPTELREPTAEPPGELASAVEPPPAEPPTAVEALFASPPAAIEERPAFDVASYIEPAPLSPRELFESMKPAVTETPIEMPARAMPLAQRPEPAAPGREPQPLRRPSPFVRPEPTRPELTAVRPEPPRPIVTPAVEFSPPTPPTPPTPPAGPPRPTRLETAVQAAKTRLLDRLVRLAVSRGAATLYLLPQTRPTVRAEGEIVPLEGEAALPASDLEALIVETAPDADRARIPSGEPAEWSVDVTDVGRVRCVSFRDHRGLGAVVRISAGPAMTVERLGLSREIQAFAALAEGLVLVAGPRASGKSTLISALVDLINRTRSDYVVTFETQVKIAHANRIAVVSQREVRGGRDEMAVVARAALREEPDVLVFEDIYSSGAVSVALEAVATGRLVIGGIAAPTSVAAISRILGLFSRERRPGIQLALAEALRGIVAQVLVRKTGGGRVAARELLLNTATVSALIGDGRFSHIGAALEAGRRQGMVPLNDALVGFVKSGAVDAREAYRKTFDRQAFVAALKREGIDASFVDRLP